MQLNKYKAEEFLDWLESQPKIAGHVIQTLDKLFVKANNYGWLTRSGSREGDGQGFFIHTVCMNGGEYTLVGIRENLDIAQVDRRLLAYRKFKTHESP